ncbi:Shedu immune nuclease family protein [Lentzea sp. NPDC051213]|uniref:Shedu immune nuclease family protein n=1 Tax=Lentzea sp. NPDC051213 TaxID=3364126 RepID=UPI0037A9F763
MAALAAGQADEATISDRLTDFAEYAAGGIPVTVLETLYQPGRRESDEHHMRLLLQVGLQRSTELLTEFTKHRPDASASDARRWLRDVTRKMERWRIGEDRLGGVKLQRNFADHMTWLSRIQLVLTDDDPKLSAEFAEELAEVPGADALAQAVQWHRRRTALDRLRAVVDAPESTEGQIHDELKKQTWIFGGRYVEELARRRLAPGDELDIPLLRGDGALHVVELKKANVPRLIEKPRSHPSVGIEVHRAMTQAANYLRSLDENRAQILATHGIECRRAFATVLIGHPSFDAGPYTPEEISEAFRTYNATLSRIEVITYGDLIESAERTLALDAQ